MGNMGRPECEFAQDPSFFQNLRAFSLLVSAVNSAHNPYAMIANFIVCVSGVESGTQVGIVTKEQNHSIPASLGWQNLQRRM